MSEGTKTITFTRDNLSRLKKIYEDAISSGKSRDDVIEFDGHSLLLGYAKYLIDYIEFRFEYN